MRDEDKTKQQLIAELQALRAELDDRADSNDETAPARAQRRPTETPIAFVATFDLLKARGVDVSDTGIGFETDEALAFEMEFELDGRTHQHTAHLVWMRRHGEGSRLGFRLTDSEPSGLLSVRKLLDTPEIEMPEEE